MQLPPISRTRLAIIGLAVVVAGGAAYLALGGDDSGDAPVQWDPAVSELVTFAETERGAAFVRPVIIDVVDADEFARQVGAGPDGPSAEDRAHVERTVQLLRGLGLVTDELDDDLVADVASRVLDGDDLARYLGAGRIVVRGTSLAEIDAVTETELAAALGVALNDQHLPVVRASRLDRSTAALAGRALEAGVSAVFADRWIAEQSASAQAAWERHQRTRGGEAANEIAAAMVLFAEALGPPLVDVALADTIVGDGRPNWSRVNQLLGSPPRTELELVQPWAALDGFEPVGVAAPSPEEGAEVISTGQFGAASLYLVIGLRTDPRDALAASLVWAGDAHIVTRDTAGRVCVAIAVAGRDGDASDLFEGVMEAWVDSASSASDASVSRDGRIVTLRSCDPGSGAPTGITLDPGAVLRVPIGRTRLLAELRAEGETRANAVCVADLVLAGIPVAAIREVDAPPEAATLYEQLLEESRLSCRRL